MDKHLKDLTAEEKSLLFNIPALIAVLVAGAEGKIDKKELDWSEKTVHFRAHYKDSKLHDYYLEVEKYIHDAVTGFIKDMPVDTAERQAEINSELSKVNSILTKIDHHFAVELYNSFISFAKQVAKSSGGVVGYGAITPSEEKVLSLDAIKHP